jgi:hypothetical protein
VSVPFKRVGKGKYRSPSGRKFTAKQVRLYYATKGFKRKARRKR